MIGWKPIVAIILIAAFVFAVFSVMVPLTVVEKSTQRLFVEYGGQDWYVATAFELMPLMAVSPPGGLTPDSTVSVQEKITCADESEKYQPSSDEDYFTITSIVFGIQINGVPAANSPPLSFPDEYRKTSGDVILPSVPFSFPVLSHFNATAGDEIKVTVWIKIDAYHIYTQMGIPFQHAQAYSFSGGSIADDIPGETPDPGPGPGPDPGTGGSWKFTVQDSVTHSPIVGADVHFGTMSGKTDSTGVYTFNNIPPGTYSFTISANGYAPTTKSGLVIEETNNDFESIIRLVKSGGGGNETAGTDWAPLIICGSAGAVVLLIFSMLYVSRSNPFYLAIGIIIFLILSGIGAALTFGLISFESGSVITEALKWTY